MKNQIQLTVYFFILSFTAISCSPKIGITNNTYQSFVESGLLMSGSTVRFYGDNQFEFKQWSDDISSNKKGKGKYQIEGNNLMLNFEVHEEERNEVKTQVTSSSDSNTFKMHIQDSKKNPLLGVICSVWGDESNPLTHCATDKNGECQLKSDNLSEAKEIKVSCFGMNEEIIDLKGEKAVDYEVTLTEKINYYPAETRFIYTFKTQKNILILDDGKKVQRLQIVE